MNPRKKKERKSCVQDNARSKTAPSLLEGETHSHGDEGFPRGELLVGRCKEKQERFRFECWNSYVGSEARRVTKKGRHRRRSDPHPTGRRGKRGGGRPLLRKVFGCPWGKAVLIEAGGPRKKSRGGRGGKRTSKGGSPKDRGEASAGGRFFKQPARETTREIEEEKIGGTSHYYVLLGVARVCRKRENGEKTQKKFRKKYLRRKTFKTEGRKSGDEGKREGELREKKGEGERSARGRQSIVRHRKNGRAGVEKKLPQSR